MKTNKQMREKILFPELYKVIGRLHRIRYKIDKCKLTKHEIVNHDWVVNEKFSVKWIRALEVYQCRHDDIISIPWDDFSHIKMYNGNIGLVDNEPACVRELNHVADEHPYLLPYIVEVHNIDNTIIMIHNSKTQFSERSMHFLTSGYEFDINKKSRYPRKPYLIHVDNIKNI